MSRWPIRSKRNHGPSPYLTVSRSAISVNSYVEMDHTLWVTEWAIRIAGHQLMRYKRQSNMWRWPRHSERNCEPIHILELREKRYERYQVTISRHAAMVIQSGALTSIEYRSRPDQSIAAQTIYAEYKPTR